MEEAVRTYLDKIRSGMVMAGTADGIYSSENLDLDEVRYFEFQEKEDQDYPLCLKEPER